MVWCDCSIELLKAFWADGHSASKIAERINARLGTSFSRSAIIGKKHRLKLPDRVSNKVLARAPIRKPPQRPPRSIERRRMFRSLPPIEPATVPEPSSDAFDAECRAAGLTTLAEIGEHDCRWPIGDPRKPGFGFCGLQVIPEQTYCPHHTRRAFAASAPRARPRPEPDRPYAPSKTKELVE